MHVDSCVQVRTAMLDCLVAQSQTMVQRQPCTSLCISPARWSERAFKESAVLVLVVVFGDILGERM